MKHVPLEMLGINTAACEVFRKVSSVPRMEVQHIFSYCTLHLIFRIFELYFILAYLLLRSNLLKLEPVTGGCIDNC